MLLTFCIVATVVLGLAFLYMENEKKRMGMGLMAEGGMTYTSSSPTTTNINANNNIIGVGDYVPSIPMVASENNRVDQLLGGLLEEVASTVAAIANHNHNTADEL